jgi:hypothetical protein
VASFCLLSLASAQLANQTVDMINAEFSDEIWGEDRDFWQLVDTLYEEH